tara:strand:- start:199 stop:831 length:633 start_codon:yes stop_codon:yes gene_type:complete
MGTSSQICGTGLQILDTEPAGTTVQWNQPQNINSDDGTPTAPFSALTSSTTATRYLKAAEFGHSIPVGATINGIELELDMTIAGTSVRPYQIRLSGVTTGLSDDLSDGLNLPSNQTKTFGDSSETWGNSWTISELEADTFSAYISVTGTAPSNFFSTNIDYVKTIIYYTEAGGGGGGGPDFNIKIGGQSISRIMMGDQPIGRVNHGSTSI